jgi:lipopolysaccharide export LptBFGC system permease protein LptF
MTMTVESISPAGKDQVVVVLRGDNNAFFSRVFDNEVAQAFSEGDEWEFIPVRKDDYVRQLRAVQSQAFSMKAFTLGGLHDRI